MLTYVSKQLVFHCLKKLTTGEQIAKSVSIITKFAHLWTFSYSNEKLYLVPIAQIFIFSALKFLFWSLTLITRTHWYCSFVTALFTLSQCCMSYTCKYYKSMQEQRPLLILIILLKKRILLGSGQQRLILTIQGHFLGQQKLGCHEPTILLQCEVEYVLQSKRSSVYT